MSVSSCNDSLLLFCLPDPASSPGDIVVGDVTKDKIPLEWTKPKQDGGSPISGYHVEKLNPDTNRWERVNKTPIRGTKFTVSRSTY